MRTRLIIVRHGESASNVQHVIAGHLDVPLTALGEDQARQTAAHLASEPIEAVYSSDLKRARDTAKPHAASRGLSVITDPDLREICCGRWEGRSKAELEQTDTKAYCEDFRYHYFGFTMPEGESEPACRERFYNAALRIAKQYPGKTVLIVSHGAVIRSFWAKICGYRNEEADRVLDYPSNASYSVAEFDGERFVSIAFSQDSHLSAVTHVHI